MKFIPLFLIMNLFVLQQNLMAEISYPDFVVSMLRKGNDLSKYEDLFIHKQNGHDFSNTMNLEIFRNVYARNVLSSLKKDNTHRIPKIVHQIWLGSPVPIKYYAWMSSWMNWLGWEYKLWTEDDLKSIFLYNQELYDLASNYGEKSDILRLEILLHFGGIYADVDFECVNSAIFDELNRSYDFYIGFEPIGHGTINGTYKTCNALIAAAPHHPLVKSLVVNLKSNWFAHEHETAVEKSGPDYLSRTILDFEKNYVVQNNDGMDLRNIYLPCTFLYPFSEPEIRGAKNRDDLISRISPETAAIHYWSGSWFIPGGR